MSNGGLALIRLAAALLVLVVASPALALPVTYDFTASSSTDLSGINVPGTFVYDAETGVGTLTSFVAPFFAGGPIDLAQPGVWPDARDRFPLTYLSVVFDPDGPTFEHATIDILIQWIVVASSPYGFGCAEGTPFPDCPPSAFPYQESAHAIFAVELVAEPAGLGALAAALLATRRRAALPRT